MSVRPGAAGGTTFAPDPPYIPSTAPVVSPETGVVSLVWLLYQQAQDKATHGLQISGSDHILATHAQRVADDASQVPAGTFLVEVDRNGLLYVAGQVKNAWTYAAGILAVPLAQVPADLGVHDAGLLVAVTDFAHVVRWDGANWGWALSDGGPGAVVTFAVQPPPGPGWAVCDGTATTYLVLAGNQIVATAFVTPVTANTWFRR